MIGLEVPRAEARDVPTAPSPSGCKRRRVHTGLLFCLPPGWAQNGAQADFFCCHGPKKFRGGDKKRNRLRIYRCGWWSRERSTSACASQRSVGCLFRLDFAIGLKKPWLGWKPLDDLPFRTLPCAESASAWLLFPCHEDGIRSVQHLFGVVVFL